MSSELRIFSELWIQAQAAGRCAREGDLVEPRVLRGLELAQTVVDAALNALQRLLALDDGLLLLAEFFFDAVDVLVFQKVGDLRQRQVERAQIPDGAEHLELRAL